MKPVFLIFAALCLLLNAGSVFAQNAQFWRARMFAPLSLTNGQIDTPPPIPASIEALEESLTGTSGENCFHFENPFYEFLSFHRVVVYDLFHIFPDDDPHPYDAFLKGVHGHLEYASVWGNKAPQRALKNMDAKLEKCSLPVKTGIHHGKTIPVWKGSIWDDRDPDFDTVGAMVLAGPSVKDNVTRYWRQEGKTHIRIPVNNPDDMLYTWAKKEGIPLELRRRKGPQESESVWGKTAIPVFIVAPTGLMPARIVNLVGGSRDMERFCNGNWMELALEDDAAPPVWAVIALRDPDLAQEAKVTRQRQLETQEKGTHSLETKRGVLRLEFKNDALPPLTLVARQLGFRIVIHETSEEGPWVDTGKNLQRSVWTTEIFIPDEAYAKQNAWNPSATFGRPISFLGSPGCPPPAPE